MEYIAKEADRLGISVDDFKVTSRTDPRFPGIVEYSYEIPKVEGAGKNTGFPQTDANGNVELNHLLIPKQLTLTHLIQIVESMNLGKLHLIKKFLKVMQL